MIALIITAAECPVALCALPTSSHRRLPPAIHSPLKLYLLISLSGAVTLFSRLMPRGKAKSDLPIARGTVSPQWFVLFFFLLPQLSWKAISPSTTRHNHFNNSVNRERQILLSFYNHDFYVKEILSDGIKVHLLEYNFEVLESVDKCEFFTTSTPYTLLVMCSIYRNSFTWEFPFLCYFILELSHRGQYWKFYSLHLFDTLNDSSHCTLHQSATSTIRILIWS